MGNYTSLETALENVKKEHNLLEISQEFLTNLVHSALAFDNHDITKEEVAKVLSGAYVGVTSERVQKILNQRNAFVRIVDMAKNNIDMDENTLKDLHQLLMEGFDVSGGLYRNVDISVKGSNHTPPSHIKVYDRMKKYFDYVEGKPSANPWEYISYCHLQIAKIHPFLDGNGRLARLILNYNLMKYGYAPVIITEDKRNEYHNTLEKFKVEKEITPFMNFLADLELETLNQY